MKKRVLCFALCLVLLLPAVLAGCKNSTNIEDKIQQTATTISMWVVTENENSVSEEAKKLVSARLDEITKDRFKVHLIVNYITEDVYRETMDREILGFYETRATTNPITDDDDEQKTAETEVNEWGITVIKYPALLAHQVDIVYIEGEEMFKTYAGSEWLHSLNLELNGNSKAIRSNINADLLNAASVNGDIYAIPNNHAVGEYTVMLLNKELMVETDADAIYRQGKIDGFFNSYIYNYLEEVRAKGDSGIQPVNADYDDCLELLAYFWNINPDTLENEGGLSILGYRYEDLSELSRSVPLEFNSLFADPEFTKAFLKLKEYQYDGGYFGTAEEGQTAALSIVKMGYDELAAYRAAGSEYYPVVLKNPTISEEDVYGSMFGVCSQTVSLEHSMKVITLLNTNAEFRNILQYGIEGKTYQLVPDPNDNAKKIVSYLSDYPYKMDIFKTGNAFLTYPLPEMDENIWEYGKVQNRDISGADPTLDLNFRSIALDTMEEDENDYMLETAPTYQVRLSTGITKAVVSGNPVIWNWIPNEDQTVPEGSLLALQSSKTMANEKTKYTYLVYAPNLEYMTSVSVDSKQENATLNLDISFDDTDIELDPESDLMYALWLVTVEAGADIEKVNFNLNRNGEKANPTITVPETDPDFTYCGKLDSELVRYIYELNAKLVEKIEACSNLAELRALLLEMKRLLTPHENDDWILQINALNKQDEPIGYAEEVAQYTVLSDLIAGLDLEEVNYAIVCATSKQEKLRKDTTVDENGKTVVEQVEYDVKSREKVPSLKSAYALYADWLKNNGYAK